MALVERVAVLEFQVASIPHFSRRAEPRMPVTIGHGFGVGAIGNFMLPVINYVVPFE